MTFSCRNDFPMLVGSDERSTAYLDSAATTLRPKSVIDAMRWYMEEGTAAVHRGMHRQSIAATDRFEGTRSLLATWLGADDDEIIFTPGTTSAVHLLRRGLKNLNSVAVTAMEHHSNFVPWMDIPKFEIIPVDPSGTIDMDALEKILSQGIDLLAITHVSNVLGCVTPIEEIIQLAHRFDTKVFVDAAQSASHFPIDVHPWDVDFLACSAHKMLGPSGVGSLFAHRRTHEDLRPVVLGGQMVDQVSLSEWMPQPPPHCYEAGSPAAESVIGWGAAIEYLNGIGRDTIMERMRELTTGLIDRLATIPGITILGPQSGERAPLASFVIEGLEAHSIAKILSRRDDIVVRSGFHCAQPLHQHLGLGPTVRASLQIYNNEDDLDRLTETLRSVAKLRLL